MVVGNMLLWTVNYMMLTAVNESVMMAVGASEQEESHLQPPPPPPATSHLPPLVPPPRRRSLDSRQDIHPMVGAVDAVCSAQIFRQPQADWQVAKFPGKTLGFIF